MYVNLPANGWILAALAPRVAGRIDWRLPLRLHNLQTNDHLSGPPVGHACRPGPMARRERLKERWVFVEVSAYSGEPVLVEDKGFMAGAGCTWATTRGLAQRGGKNVGDARLVEVMAAKHPAPPSFRTRDRCCCAGAGNSGFEGGLYSRRRRSHRERRTRNFRTRDCRRRFPSDKSSRPNPTNKGRSTQNCHKEIKKRHKNDISCRYNLSFSPHAEGQ